MCVVEGTSLLLFDLQCIQAASNIQRGGGEGGRERKENVKNNTYYIIDK